MVFLTKENDQIQRKTKKNRETFLDFKGFPCTFASTFSTFRDLSHLTPWERATFATFNGFNAARAGPFSQNLKVPVSFK